jgi:processive 1,2-diacylglycerol beta-glucosyltransferase
MSRILLLHASVGMGHQRAAAALAQAFEQAPGTSALVEDTLQHARTFFRRSYAGLYLGIADWAPEFWSFFYAQTDRPPSSASLVAGARALSTSVGVRGLPALLERARPDAIICTHFLPVEALAPLRQNLPPLYCVLTDYHAHQFWAHAGVDGYFVPTPATQSQLVAAGIARPRVHVTGIPITPIISAPADRTAARHALGLAPQRRVVTLIGSGLPAERVRSIVVALLAQTPSTTLLVTTGRNEDLAAQLADLEVRAGAIVRVLGPQPSLDPLIVASDLVVGKAGGLTVSEVLGRGVPLIIPTPVPGQEQWNADHVIDAGAGLGRESAQGVAQAVAGLLADPARLTAMAAAARAAGRPMAAQSIAAHVLEDLAWRRAPRRRGPATIPAERMLLT